MVTQQRAFDAIVVGSGMTGGWAAKELTEAGLETLVLEAGPATTPATDYVEHTAVLSIFASIFSCTHNMWWYIGRIDESRSGRCQ